MTRALLALAALALVACAPLVCSFHIGVGRGAPVPGERETPPDPPFPAR